MTQLNWSHRLSELPANVIALVWRGHQKKRDAGRRKVMAQKAFPVVQEAQDELKSIQIGGKRVPLAGRAKRVLAEEPGEKGPVDVVGGLAIAAFNRQLSIMGTAQDFDGGFGPLPAKRPKRRQSE